MATLKSTMELLEKHSKEAEERLADKNTAKRESASDPQAAEMALLELGPLGKSSSVPKKRIEKIGRKLVKAADDKLLQGEQLGLFASLPVSDAKTIPTLLARLPIFIPVPASKQAKLLDRDLAYRFETPFGRGRRFGPPVTIEDEDVLFAIMQLSEHRLMGKGSKLPIPLENDQWLNDDKGNLTVQVTIATVGQINAEIGLSRAGKNYKATLASIKRLNHVGIELETRKKDLYLGDSWDGEKIRLIDIKWRAYKEEGLIFAQFSPVMVKWLKEQATFFNWSVRRKITSPNGKALHRFLSTQGKHYRAELNYIADAIEWDGNRNRIRPRMEAVLKQLRGKPLNWCDYEITGTGRGKPFVLEFWRRRT